MIGPRDIGARLPTRFGNRIDPYGFNGYREPRGYLGGPVPPVSGYDIWWDASDKATFVTDSSGKIYLWMDKSASRAHLHGLEIAGNAANNLPTLTTRTINGVIVPEFTTPAGVEGLMTRGGVGLMNDPTCTWYVVALLDTTSNYRVLFSGDVNDTLYVRANITTGLVEADERGVSVIATTTGAITTGQAFQLTVRLNSGASPGVELRLDGASDSTSYTSSFTGTSHRIMVGCSGNNNQWDGLIAELIRFPTSHGSSDITAMEDYLSAKWGTP